VVLYLVVGSFFTVGLPLFYASHFLQSNILSDLTAPRRGRQEELRLLSVAYQRQYDRLTTTTVTVVVAGRMLDEICGGEEVLETASLVERHYVKSSTT
jgi:hypothetical protein